MLFQLWYIAKQIGTQIKRQNLSEKRGRFAVDNSIHDSQKDVKIQGMFGHWKLDTVVLSRAENKRCFAKFVERKTRLYTSL